MRCQGITKAGVRCARPSGQAGFCVSHSLDAQWGRNRAAVEASIPHLATDPSHSAVIEAARSLADAVDGSPADEKLWREYRFALSALMGVGVGVDTLDAELEELRKAALGDTPHA